MYNKLFTKILDSSVWLESAYTRLVWLTLVAVMDEDGFCPFAAVGNLAARARVPLKACQDAVTVLESPDAESSNPDNEGRRIERVPGGWIVLNAGAHRDMVTRAIVQERTRERVRRHRAKKASNAPVTFSNASVTPSEAVSEARSETKSEKVKPYRSLHSLTDEPLAFTLFYGRYPRKTKRADALKAWVSLNPSLPIIDAINHALNWQTKQPAWVKEGGKFIPYPASWLRARQWEDEPFHTQPRQPDYEAALSWQDECQALHGGRCGNPTFHAAKMEDA